MRLPVAPPRTATPGTVLSVIGALLIALGVVGIAGCALTAEHSTSGPSGQSSSRSPTESSSSPTSAAPSLQIGQCVTEAKYRSGHVSVGSDCSDPQAVYELVARGSSNATCPDGKQSGSLYDLLGNDSQVLCFMPNLMQGQCYQRMHGGVTDTVAPVDCADTSSVQFQVLLRVDGSNDTTRCPPRSNPLAFPQPLRLYCIGAARS